MRARYNPRHHTRTWISDENIAKLTARGYRVSSQLAGFYLIREVRSPVSGSPNVTYIRYVGSNVFRSYNECLKWLVTKKMQGDKDWL